MSAGGTFIVDVLGGRVTTPENFNVWAQTWRTPDRGVQQLMLEPLIVEYVTGEVIMRWQQRGRSTMKTSPKW